MNYNLTIAKLYNTQVFVLSPEDKPFFNKICDQNGYHFVDGVVSNFIDQS